MPRVRAIYLYKSRILFLIYVNNMPNQVRKTKIMSMSFTTKQKLKKLVPTKIKIRNTPNAVVSSYKYLGVTLDNTLNYTNHMNNIFKMIGYKIYLLTKMRRYLTFKAAERVYKAMNDNYQLKIPTP